MQTICGPNFLFGQSAFGLDLLHRAVDQPVGFSEDRLGHSVSFSVPANRGSHSPQRAIR